MSNFNFKERHEVKDQLNIIGQGIPKRTRIIAKDHDTGEVIGIYENKILVPGSQMTAAKLFGIEQKVIFPTYNTELGLENSLEP